MAIDDGESCGSHAMEGMSPKQSRKERLRHEVFNEVLNRLQELDRDEVKQPGFEDDLWQHFNRLPARYSMDVNVDRAEDVLLHKRLLDLAKNSDNRPVFEIRPVQTHFSPFDNEAETIQIDASTREDAQSHYDAISQRRNLVPPAFGSTSNLEVLLPANAAHGSNVQSDLNSVFCMSRPRHEIVLSTIDKPKMLSQMATMLSEMGLNIEEAHAFSTNDGFSLDIFVIAGWSCAEAELLRSRLHDKIIETENDENKPSMENENDDKPDTRGKSPDTRGKSPDTKGKNLDTRGKNPDTGSKRSDTSGYLKIPSDGDDVWEIDVRQLRFGNQIASGAFGDLYKGSYCSQEVAIKVLNPEKVKPDKLKEFSQEVFILRKIRHKNVVQFLGACTKPPNLCIVTEFMSRGSVFHFLQKHKGINKLSTLLKVAVDVCKGMNYLHQNHIIHRDLKTANLLMDDFGVIKITDFGVARVVDQTGVMTAETGTYRWMAPEVIEHKPYDHKVDVFSFGIVIWELLTGEIPYSDKSPLQAAVGVVQKGLRPPIPANTHPKLVELIHQCWQPEPVLRPNFPEILERLQQLKKDVGGDSPKGKLTGLISSLKKGHHH